MSGVANLFNRLNFEEKLFISLAVFFLVGAFLFIIFLLLSRILKNRRRLEESGFKEGFQHLINDIIFIDTPSQLALSTEIKNLQKCVGQSPVGKQVLIDHLIGLRRNLSGIAAQNLRSTFRLLRLFEFSQQKLNAHQWDKKAQGVYELGEMDYVEAKEKIRTFLVSGNRTLRDEAFTALLKLEKDSPMSFLDDYQGSLSLWMRLRIHNHLAHSDKRQLPDFSRWFLNPNVEVVLFAISMARQFRQLSTAPMLVSLLRDSDSRKVNLAVTTLGELGTYEYAGELVSIVDLYWQDAKLSLRMVKSIGKLSTATEHWNVVARYLQHSNYAVRFEAALALHQSGNSQLLKDQALNPNGPMDSLIRHVEEPLLQLS